MLIFDRSSVVAQPTSRKPLHRPQGLAHAARTQQAAALWLQALRSAGSLSSSGRASSLLSLSRNSTTMQSRDLGQPDQLLAVSTTPKNVRGLLRGVDGPSGALRRAGRRRVGGGSKNKFTSQKRAALPQGAVLSAVLRRVKFLLYCLQPQRRGARATLGRLPSWQPYTRPERRRALELARATSPQRLGTPRRAARRRDAVVTPSGRLAF